MNETSPKQPRAISLDKPLTIAILAMGGQGGGVLADWIVEVAEHVGWAAQSTSVPGVAQRTGATIYYIETLPPRNGVSPVFSLMPTPGDVDVVMAAELMEAGRSVLRGLVTPDKTTLIASTHRAYAVAEKEKPGDGAGDPFIVVDALDFAARRTIAFDMEKLAVERGTVISAALLGALAGSGALPFERSAYEAIVREGARGANASLAAFADAYDRSREGKNEAPNTGPQKRLDDLPADAGHPELNRLVARLRSDLPEAPGRWLSRASNASSISRMSLTATTTSTGCKSWPRSTRPIAARRRNSPSRRKRQSGSRSPWRMMTSSASPTSNCVRRDSRVCAKRRARRPISLSTPRSTCIPAARKSAA